MRTSYQSTTSRPSPSGPNATRGRRAGRSTAAATTRGSSSPGPERSSSTCRSCAARPSRRPSSSATAGARPRSRRPSSRCTWRASRPGGSRTSPSSCGERRCPPAPSPTSTRGPSRPSRPGGRGRSMAATPTSSSTASTSSAAGEGPTRTWPCWSPSASTPPATGRSSAAPGGVHRVRGVLARVLLLSQGTRALRRAARQRRQVRGDARRARGGVSRGPITGAARCISTARAGKGPRDQAEGRGAHAEGDPRAGIARGMRQKGRGGGGKAGVDEARGGREDGARRVRRNAGRHGIPARALAPDQDEQRDRAHQPRDQEEDEGRRDLLGRQLGPHAGDGETEVNSGARVGQGAVPQ